MPEARTEKTDEGRTRLLPSATSADSLGVRVSLIAWGIGVGLWIWLAESAWAWGIGAGVAMLCGGALLQDVRKWMRGRSLRSRLGEPILSVDACPTRIGERIGIRIAQRVRSPVRVKAVTVRLHCDGARIETYGIQSRKQRVWSEVFDDEVVALRGATFEAGDVLTAEAGIRLPADQHQTSEWTRWWVLVETSIDGCPPYEATFPLEVLRADEESA